MTSPLTDLIRAEIGRHGAIPFARYMELALYHPEHGYYERGPAVVGRRGDFYTSASVGPLFGELLAWQFARWAESGGGSQESGVRSQDSKRGFQIVEAGAHDGRLAADILRALRQLQPELAARLEYWIIEPSARRQTWQRETLAEFAPQVHWLTELPAASAEGQFHGVLFANELLDSFPVQRLGWDARARAWFEWGVTVRDGTFVWTRLEARPAAATDFNFRDESMDCTDQSRRVPSPFLGGGEKVAAGRMTGGAANPANPSPQPAPLLRGGERIHEPLKPAISVPEPGRSAEHCSALGRSPVPAERCAALRFMGREPASRTPFHAPTSFIPNWHYPLPAELLAVLPDGFILEVCPAAAAWWEVAARSLRSGRLLTLDYGLSAEEFLSPARAGGTLRAYHQHHQSADLLAQPGDQDLTAHVNFTALQRAGESAGLRTVALLPQAQFLTRIAETAWQSLAAGAAWDAARVRQFQTLTHPEHLGRAFRVLVQSRP